ncbi:hypothetical protein QBC38DRAFT_504021 [Podospora fimiseda]|uniref:Secreted protein n=1 Tax=Podospora fimiseda TaxID=252190 RepID=A0AAN6YPB9_9PEZI|nr:hypothetical protein QBC38DRAFT_504021 [Podospora fimiseda]
MSPDSFAGCCLIVLSVCNIATACTDGTQQWLFQNTDSCGRSETCYSMTIYGTYPSQLATENWVDVAFSRLDNEVVFRLRGYKIVVRIRGYNYPWPCRNRNAFTFITAPVVTGTPSPSSPPSTATTNPRTPDDTEPSYRPRLLARSTIQDKQREPPGYSAATAGWYEAPPTPAPQPYVAPAANKGSWLKRQKCGTVAAVTQVQPPIPDATTQSWSGYGQERTVELPGYDATEQQGRPAELPVNFAGHRY